ncbi:endonuclease-reverse transcriptase [Elysia marginata]|uniref:Endonuclease-reverse transcriptase n=1 Tax=Elysia marginata TaxID=1093978 RepID=A0AAV4I7V9_9GAST|nr:endonuclease-reverse transcriptase [Elysia marginata]
MFETGKLAQVTSEMNRYNLHILGVSESRWTGTGRYKTNTGDLYAKVGDENIGAERTMGIHGCGSINNNGERLVELCASNDLVIGGTLFEHPAIHKLT